MSIYTPPGFRATLRSFLDADGLPFNAALSEGLVERIAAEEGVDFADGPDAVYSPAVTLFAWLSQAISASKSCVAAVARVLVLRVAQVKRRPKAQRLLTRTRAEERARLTRGLKD